MLKTPCSEWIGALASEEGIFKSARNHVFQSNFTRENVDDNVFFSLSKSVYYK
jgi:hypothetical protein